MTPNPIAPHRDAVTVFTGVNALLVAVVESDVFPPHWRALAHLGQLGLQIALSVWGRNVTDSHVSATGAGAEPPR